LRWFDNGVPTEEFLSRLDAVRHVLTAGGRTLAQGALAWIWARSERAVPLPGFRTVAHVRDSLGVQQFGPLAAEEFDAVERALGRESVHA
jgi:aryl-alcohol dehydrogenase-like predicted oxidoreductase